MSTSPSHLSPSTAETVDTLVAYSDNAIVSRTLAKTKGGTLTCFAFDQGQELSEHSAPFDAIVQILDGEAELIIDGQSIAAQTGQIVCMPANIPHAVKATKRFKMLLTMLRDMPEQG